MSDEITPPKRRVTKRRIILLVVVLCCVVTGGLLYACHCLTTSPLRRALPWGADDVRDHYVDMTPDYAYYLKASISESDFRRYCARLRLTPHTPQRTYTDDLMWLSWDALAPIDWWNPSPGIADTHVLQEGRHWTFAKHENGTLYLKAWRH